MEKHSKFFQKSILLLDFSSDLCSNLALLDNVLSRTFKEIKLYFITSTQITDYSYSYLEKLMTFLYHYIFEAKNKDFQFKTGIFFPFLFPNQSLTKFFEAFLIKNNSFNVILNENSI